MNNFADSATKPSPWNPRLLLFFHLLAILILLSWLIPFSRQGWDIFDQQIYRYLNGSLLWGESWQAFWAIANWRPFDLVPGTIILIMLGLWLRQSPSLKEANRRIIQIALFALLIGFIKVVSFEIIVDLFDFRRLSPTRIFDDGLRLTEMVTWIKTKDSSGSSFPGDHALVMILLTGFFFFHQGRKAGFQALVLLFPFYLPRLVGGAHWSTDILIGSLCLGLLGLAWWRGSPLSERLPTQIAERLDHPLTWFSKKIVKT
ncbi:phosphatase PAP2 family protein [Magnetococcales bacterium HHB-1]